MKAGVETKRVSRRATVSPVFLLLLAPAIVFGGPQTETRVTTTTYLRNDDGAPTAMIVQVDDQPAVTTYFTWDNFEPNVADPTTGTVSAGNGNLLGFGPTPGGGYTTQLSFDQRDRITAASVSGSTSVAYAYDAGSSLAGAELASGDQMQFFYNTDDIQLATNLYQPSTGTWSSSLDDTTYLSNGVEQVRLMPRKDVAGEYDDAAQSFTPIQYEPYGSAMTPAAPTSAYDMTQNPFRYAGEFNDPVWDGYYLRHRWYLAAAETFVSRDPADLVRRYGYAAGNPVVDTDPSGLRASSFSRFVNRTLLRPLTTGVVGDFAPLFLGSEITVLEIAANPRGFWHQIRTNQQGIDLFLAASVASELVFAGADWVERPIGFRTKVGVGTALGVTQSAVAGVTRRGFNFKRFGLGLEYSANAVLNTRYFDEKNRFDALMSSREVSHYVEEEFNKPEVRNVSLTAYPNRPSGPITAWWARVRGTPQDMYDVSITRDEFSRYWLQISGDQESAFGDYDPTRPAREQIKATAASSGFNLDKSRYIPADSVRELDDAAIERRAPFVEARRPPVLRYFGRATLFTLTRIRGWISLLHYN